jgi:hypothetical protein
MDIINCLQLYENYEELREPMIDIPTKKEEIVFVKSKTTYKQKCNACDKSSRLVYTLFVGETRLIKLCPFCKKRLIKAKCQKNLT